MGPGAPNAVADSSGVYVTYPDNAGEFRRFKMGELTPKIARWFGSTDQDVVGGRLYVHQNSSDNNPGTPVGYGPYQRHRAWHKVTNNLLSSPSPLCPGNTPSLLSRGGSSAATCYVPDPSTGDFVIQHKLNAIPTGGSQHAWRSCMAGNSSGLFTDDCDLVATLSFFRPISQATAVNLRATVQASGPTGNIAYAGLNFRIKADSGTEVELIFTPFYAALGGCIEQVGTDGTGRRLWLFTPVCVGSTNLGSGQTRFYNLDLKSYIVARIADGFRGRIPDLDFNLDHWHVSWGLSAATVASQNVGISASYSNPALDVLY